MALEAIKQKLQGQIGATFTRINPQKPKQKIFYRLKGVKDSEVQLVRLDNTAQATERGEVKTMDIGEFVMNYRIAPPGTVPTVEA